MSAGDAPYAAETLSVTFEAVGFEESVDLSRAFFLLRACEARAGHGNEACEYNGATDDEGHPADLLPERRMAINLSSAIS